LRTLRYRNTAATPTGAQRRIEIVVNDDRARSEVAEVTTTVRGQNSAPTLEQISNTVVLAGSPLHLPLNGEDSDGDRLSYTVTSSNPSVVEPVLLSGNRSLRLSVDNFGDMVFQLYEDRAPRATSQIIALAEQGFYNGIIFHRVVNGFVIQAGDPTGTGRGGSDRPDFDDQFHVDLQHNRSGILSMAKTTDDTNDSQFFITEGPTRHLDFNHTIFGQLVEGESVREAISNVAVDAQDKPRTEVRIGSAQVFVDNQNAVVMLKSPPGASGTAKITVNVSDGRGGSLTREFDVTVQADTVNGGPFLADIPSVRTRVGVPTEFQLVGRDPEGDPVFYLDEAALKARSLFVPVAANPELQYSVNPTTGLVSVRPGSGLVGTFQITVAAAASLDGLTNASHIDYQRVTVTVNNSPVVDPT
jgi:cyclophilin family peptidyl-prolyl cis-trans isomerase